MQESITKAAFYLLNQQQEDGHFEGELSANTFPTCAYTLVQVALGRLVDDALVEWFVRNQNEDGYWGLDAFGGSDNEATSFAKLALMEIKRITDSDERSTNLRDRIESALVKCPGITLNLWIVKLMYARCGYISWEEVIPPWYISSGMRLVEWLTPILPKSLLSRLKPPVNYSPPVRLFYSDVFQDLFIAEKHTIVPLLLIIETHIARRKDIVAELANWLLENRCDDGSWFRVGFITAASVLALIDAKAFGYENAVLNAAICEGEEWLQRLRTRDGGCREAVNLNVWDTALSIISLADAGADKYAPQMSRAALWLLENQNADGGWPFSGLPGGRLPSDADDTALASLALLKSGVNRDHDALKRSFEWLRAHQSQNGGWGTYRPGAGDVSCVSITSHVIEACLAMEIFREEISRGLNWLKVAISSSGYWRDLWLSRNIYGTATAIAALYKSGHSDCDEVKRGIRWLEQNQNPDGGWGEDMEGRIRKSTVEQTAWSTYALLLNDARNPSAWKGIDCILKCQNPDGSWPSSCVGIYWEVIGGYADTVYPSVFSLMALSRAASL